jgi:hypothetical protein
MKTCEWNEIENNALRHSSPGAGHPSAKPSHLYLVTVNDLQDLRAALTRGHVPPDLEAKLGRLANGDLCRRSIEKNCRTIIGLLQANLDGSFRQLSLEERERLLRVLAYVRKDDDAISDFLSDGFVDDQQELRVVTATLSHRLEDFKVWRLRHQVPAMWQGSAM